MEFQNIIRLLDKAMQRIIIFLMSSYIQVGYYLTAEVILPHTEPPTSVECLPLVFLRVIAKQQ